MLLTASCVDLGIFLFQRAAPSNTATAASTNQCLLLSLIKRKANPKQGAIMNGLDLLGKCDRDNNH